MEFAAFADRAAEIEAESADLEIVDLVTDLFLTAGDDLATVARFVQGRVFPAHDSTTLDIGPSLCYAAIARAAGRNVSAEDVEDRVAETGEIGAVAASYGFGGQQGLGAFGGDGEGGADPLTVGEVDARLRELAAAAGEGSQDRKLDVLFGLFNRCDPDEARYLARIVLSEMRIGVGEGTVRDAVAGAFDVPVEAVERALQVTNDYGLVAEIARDEGESGLAAQHLEVGRPVQAMLAQAGSVTDALEDWDAAAVETKFDGARVQVHYDGETVWLFSRNMEDVTDALPELVTFVEESLTVPAILDGEAVAVDDDGNPQPFQEILKRFRRKHDVAKAREEVAVELDAFDCLHADGEDLLDAPLTERHDRLVSVLDAGIAELRVTDDPDEIADIETTALEAGHEGIMLKDPDSTYSPGRRGRNWLKRKPDVETLDLVVTGAEWGEGRRAELLGTFEVSVRTDDGYATVGNVATGITDEELADLTDLLDAHVRAEDGKTVDIDPTVVFEVGYEEIQPSPTYDSGWALRFPRFVGVRDDKEPADADALDRLERLAAEQ
ncbi:ATP-dependent DNA ligase LigA [Halorientalis marina]|jgi:DNA ligase-1|uniref:ATP-dependent DNA ligase LigA n=1 Tax=Halorientalis marina TaxID=2931976 RepID=UPI001FF1149E|nr:ATP-dependent DNA ligase LigA [Halorientalis marina]